jgi:hypothetical protein
VRLADYMAAIIADLRANTMGPTGFLRDIDTHGKTFGVEELKQLSLNAPAVRIAMVGSRGGSTVGGRRTGQAGILRADTGQFVGPMQMIGFLVEQDYGIQEARDRVIMLADDFIHFIEHRQWGLTAQQCGPALVTGFEVFYTAELDAQGAAIAAVSWEQEVWFGRSLHDEDMALLTETGHDYVPDFTTASLYPEKEWADKGQLDIDKPPKGKGTATGQFVPDKAVDPEVDPDASPPEEGYKPIIVEE